MRSGTSLLLLRTSTTAFLVTRVSGPGPGPAVVDSELEY
jgi:hypothetical protein